MGKQHGDSVYGRSWCSRTNAALIWKLSFPGARENGWSMSPASWTREITQFGQDGAALREVKFTALNVTDGHLLWTMPTELKHGTPQDLTL